MKKRHFLIMGVVLGGMTALCLAPKSGEAFRNEVKRWFKKRPIPNAYQQDEPLVTNDDLLLELEQLSSRLEELAK